MTSILAWLEFAVEQTVIKMVAARASNLSGLLVIGLTGGAMVGLAACEDQNTAEFSTENIRMQQIMAVRGEERLGGFQKFVRSTGTRCGQVTTAARILQDGVFEVWQVTCADSGVWQLTIDNGPRFGIAACPDRVCPGVAGYGEWQRGSRTTKGTAPPGALDLKPFRAER